MNAYLWKNNNLNEIIKFKYANLILEENKKLLGPQRVKDQRHHNCFIAKQFDQIAI